jgi:hypothetical protein
MCNIAFFRRVDAWSDHIRDAEAVQISVWSYPDTTIDPVNTIFIITSESGGHHRVWQKKQ